MSVIPAQLDPYDEVYIDENTEDVVYSLPSIDLTGLTGNAISIYHYDEISNTLVTHVIGSGVTITDAPNGEFTESSFRYAIAGKYEIRVVLEKDSKKNTYFIGSRTAKKAVTNV